VQSRNGVTERSPGSSVAATWLSVPFTAHAMCAEHESVTSATPAAAIYNLDMATSSPRKRRATVKKVSSANTQASARNPLVASSPVRVGEFLEFLCPGVLGRATPSWPPDVFALVMAVLQKSGAYTRVVTKWPPGGKRSSKAWVEEIAAVADRWRKDCLLGKVPAEVRLWWSIVASSQNATLQDINQNGAVCDALLQLCAVADEAANGVGIPSGDGATGNEFEWRANEMLLFTSTLCQLVHPSRVRVLPKLHTPQNGLTIRSLSHHLAFIAGGEIRPDWYTYSRSQGHCLNLLIVPWPEVVQPSQFSSARPKKGNLLNMADDFGFFTYLPDAKSRVTRRLSSLLKKGKALVGNIDGVVLPELALTEAEFERASSAILPHGTFLISGVSSPSLKPGSPGKNSLRLDLPIAPGIRSRVRQEKHHRWKLDKSQISQYGLGNSLDPQVSWWEHIRMEARSLAFIAMRPWLTIAALVCEDLARQDPMADLVRSVGPNLVLALLMDAPQTVARWPARYATVLADDPGSSVLTVTSIGMAKLSRPTNCELKPRVVALWKDARSRTPIEIEMPEGTSAVVLNLTEERINEFTADGRDDDAASGYPVLSGVHFI
jgi:hypothetical protein